MKMGVAVAVLLAVVMSVKAQEYGRGTLSGEGAASGLGRAPLPKAQYDGWWGGGVWGVKGGLGWAFVDWDIGDGSGSDSLFAPQISLFYKATDYLDVNFSTMYLSAKDTGYPEGDTTADMTRLALGVRYWINTHIRLTPYLGGGLGYYILDGTTGADVDASVDPAPGAFLEGGVAFRVADGFFVNTDLTYDFLLGSADATINGQGEDFNVKSFAINVGVTWLF